MRTAQVSSRRLAEPAVPAAAAAVRIDCSVATEVLRTKDVWLQTDIAPRTAKRARTPDRASTAFDCGSGSGSGSGVTGPLATASDGTGSGRSSTIATTNSDNRAHEQRAPATAQRTSGGWGCAPSAGAPALHLARASQSLLRAAYADPRAHALLYTDFADGVAVHRHGLALPASGATKCLRCSGVVRLVAHALWPCVRATAAIRCDSIGCADSALSR
jgi:hypothetical protein